MLLYVMKVSQEAGVITSSHCQVSHLQDRVFKEVAEVFTSDLKRSTACIRMEFISDSKEPHSYAILAHETVLG